MSENQVLKLRLSLKGRPIRTLVFDQESVLIGRNPEADVCLDNPGVSRDHLRIRQTPGGYVAEDLGSANGTFVNDVAIKQLRLHHEDVVRIGKFSLWVSLDKDQRGVAAHAPAAPTADMEGATTVLSADELQKMMKVVRETETVPPSEQVSAPVTRAGSRRPGRALVVLGVCLGIAFGVAVGVGTMWMIAR